MESSSIEYIMERECSLTKVGGELDSKSYGIGMRKQYPYKDEINYAILKLQVMTVMMLAVSLSLLHSHTCFIYEANMSKDNRMGH